MIISEKDVIDKIILPLLKKLDYTLKDMKQEYSIPAGRGYVRADIVLLKNNKPLFVVDGKAPNEDLEKYKTQAISYGRLLQVKYTVLCNDTTFRCYDSKTQKVIWDKSVSELPKFLSKQKMDSNKIFNLV